MKIKDFFPSAISDHEITALVTHSQAVQPGSIFFAIVGYEHDGHLYIDEAIENGAITIVVEKQHFIVVPDHINLIYVNNCRKELARIARRLYRDALVNLPLIAITGTNGKTTVATLLFRYLRYLGKHALLIGSNGNFYDEIAYETNNTTPELLVTYQLINRHRANLQYVVMEVSSQAIRELRVLGLEFRAVLITNISQDHFDYHPNWEDYLFSKGQLLAQLRQDKCSVILNHQSPYFRFFDQLTIESCESFGVGGGDYRGNLLKSNLTETRFSVCHNGKEVVLSLPLPGDFNMENCLAVYALATALELEMERFPDYLQTKPDVPGRMELYLIKKRLVVIDYAHTPEAVRSVLSFLKGQVENRLLVVMGCGGQRDRKKRPLMASYALQYGDWVYFTQDNSRGEPWSQIIDDMLTKCSDTNYSVFPERPQALLAVMAESNRDDTIVLLGMGHEKYQTPEGPRSDYELMKGMQADD